MEEVARISIAKKRRLVWRRQLVRPERVKVNWSKEGMRTHGIVPARAPPVALVKEQQTLTHEGARGWTDADEQRRVGPKLPRRREGLEGVVVITRAKGWLASEGLEEESPQRPPVGSERRAAPLEHLRRCVLPRAHQRVGTAGVAKVYCRSEVAQLRVSRRVEEYILGLEISVDETVGVEVRECEDECRRVETRVLQLQGTTQPIIVQSASSSLPANEDTTQVTTQPELEHEKETRRILKRRMQRREEGMRLHREECALLAQHLAGRRRPST